MWGVNDLIIMLYFATTDPSRPIIGVQGQNEYATTGTARTGIYTELRRLVKDGLPFIEFVALYGMIVQTRVTYSNTPKARFRTLEDGSSFLDLRNPRGLPSSASAG